MKLLGGLVVLLALLAAVFIYRKSVRSDELQARRLGEERAARQRIDLATLPDRPPPEEVKPQPKFSKRPVVVELNLKNKKGRAFNGRYQLINSGGDIVGEHAANAEPGVFIVTPGNYELVVPDSQFRKALVITNDDDDKTRLNMTMTTK